MHGCIPDMVGKPELRHFLIPKPKRKAMHNLTESPPKKEDRSEKVSRCIRQIWNGGRKKYSGTSRHEHSIFPFSICSRMRGKGSRFTLGVWGLRVCSLDVAFVVATVRNRSQPFATVRNRSQPFATVRNRSQPFATVRNRSQPSARSTYGGAYGKFCRGGPFWRFFTCRCFVSRGRRGTLRDIQTCSGTCRKSFCVACVILL